MYILSCHRLLSHFCLILLLWHLNWLMHLRLSCYWHFGNQSVNLSEKVLGNWSKCSLDLGRLHLLLLFFSRGLHHLCSFHLSYTISMGFGVFRWRWLESFSRGRGWGWWWIFRRGVISMLDLSGCCWRMFILFWLGWFWWRWGALEGILLGSFLWWIWFLDCNYIN
jgi:hypothetical protein